MGEKLNNRKLGARQEDLAVKFLEKLGYQILERNWHWSNRGEIDIIALDAKRFGQKYLVFIEVKYRSWSMNMSLAAVQTQKIQQLKKLALAYLRKHNYDIYKTNISFDFIAIHKDEIRHIKNIV